MRYVEGYAVNMIPVERAWRIDAEGRVIDPTWAEEVAPDYFGIAFDWELVERVRKIARPSRSALFTWWKWPEIYPELICNLTKDVTR